MKFFTQIDCRLTKIASDPSELTLESVVEIIESQEIGSYTDLYPGFYHEIDDSMSYEDGDYMYDSRENVLHEAELIHGMFSSLPNPIPIWRALYLKQPDMLDVKNLGESWSIDMKSAINFGNHNNSNYLLKALLPLNAVDWRETVKRYVIFSSFASGDAEDELVVEDESAIYELEMFEIKTGRKIPLNHNS
jgi:hypothetical protein